MDRSISSLKGYISFLGEEELNQQSPIFSADAAEKNQVGSFWIQATGEKFKYRGAVAAWSW